MLPPSPNTFPQSSLFDITSQLDPNDPLLALGCSLNWNSLEVAFTPLYSELGRSAKPIRLMCGLLMLKQLYNLSDESVVEQWRMNPYYQVFCGEKQACLVMPQNWLSFASVLVLRELNGYLVYQSACKAITYPTDSKLLIKIINRLNKLAKIHGVQQRRTFVKETKSLRLACRHFRHVKRRSKAKKALKRLRTIAGVLMRELTRKLPELALEQEAQRFALYQRIIDQRRKDKNKVYSLHESDVYCVGKGKDHKAYEYGRKASVVSTKDSNIIVGVASHDEHEHDSKTLKAALESAHEHRTKAVKLAVVDRGYRGARKHIAEDIDILLPSPPLKRDNAYQRQKKRVLCRRRAAIEPIIGHLKQDYRLSRNWLKGSEGDEINLHMAACAWNLRKWMVAFFLFENSRPVGIIVIEINEQSPEQHVGINIIAFLHFNM